MTLFSEQVRALSVGLRFHNQGGIFLFGGRVALPKAVIPAPRARPILLFPQASSRSSTARSISRALHDIIVKTKAGSMRKVKVVHDKIRKMKNVRSTLTLIAHEE